MVIINKFLNIGKRGLCLAVLLVLCSSELRSQNYHINDYEFRRWLQDNFPAAMIGSFLNTNHPSVTSAQNISIYNDWYGGFIYNIQSLDGVQHFVNCKTLSVEQPLIRAFYSFPPNLEYLWVSADSLVYHPPLPSTLTHLSSSSLSYQFYDSLPQSLRYLEVHGHSTSLPTLPDSLLEFYLQYNYRLTSLNNLPQYLNKFECSDNFVLQSIPIQGLHVSEFICEDNDSLTSIGSLSPALTKIQITNNPRLSTLPAIPAGVTEITVNDNALTGLPALPTGVKEINCDRNDLSVLPALPDSLFKLECSENDLSTLPDLPADLGILICQRNKMDSLPDLPADLFILSCDYNDLRSLPELNQKLASLRCRANLLDSLPDLPNSLVNLNCSENNLMKLPRLDSTSMQIFNCGFNNLNSIPALPASLKSFYCNNNLLNSLPKIDVVSDRVNAYANSLTSLPSLSSTLRYLYIYDNPINCLPELPNSIVDVRYHNTNISCFPTHPSSYASSSPLLPICDFRNICTILNLGGIIYLDSLSNDSLDPGDRLLDYCCVSIQPGNQTTNSTSGLWGFRSDTSQQYVIRCEVPNNYYEVVPDSHFVPIATVQDTNLNFGLQALGSFNDLELEMTALTDARPGFDVRMAFETNNVGTSILNTLLEIEFDTSLTIVSSTVPYTIIANGKIQVNFGVHYNLQKKSFELTLNIPPNVALGTVLNIQATALPTVNDQTPGNNFVSDSLIVIGSFDPNDKIASRELLTNIDVQNKERIDYTIRFQNTGTASAINVRLEDSLSSHLDLSTFKVRSFSHNPRWLLDQNKLVVRYDNIYLPDSATNQELSNGYFKFSVRVKNNLTLGDTVPNFADIFFDFNEAVRTNTVKTAVYSPVTTTEIDVRDLRIYPNPSTGTYHIDHDLRSGNIAIEVYSIHGKLITRQQILNRNPLTFVIDGPRGLYFVRIIAEGMSMGSAKLIKF